MRRELQDRVGCSQRRVWGLGFRSFGFRVEGLGFRSFGFRVEGLGFRV